MASRPFSKVLKPRLRSDCDRLRIPQRRITPQLDILHHASDALVECYYRLPAKIALYLADVRPSTIRFSRSLRNVNDWSLEQVDKPVDTLRIAGAEIPNLPA